MEMVLEAILKWFLGIYNPTGYKCNSGHNSQKLGLLVFILRSSILDGRVLSFPSAHGKNTFVFSVILTPFFDR